MFLYHGASGPESSTTLCSVRVCQVAVPVGHQTTTVLVEFVRVRHLRQSLLSTILCSVCNQPLADVLMHVERGYRMESPEGCPREVYTIMKEAWDANAAARPSFAAVSARLHSLRTPPTPTAGPTAF